MERVKFDFHRDIVPAVKYRAKLAFRHKRNRQQLLDDALSLAWEAMQNAPPSAKARDIAYYSCKGALYGRQFSRSGRSIDGPNPRKVEKPLSDPDAQIGLLPSGKKDSPAEVAVVRVDFGAWVQTLTSRQKEFLLAFLYGESTGEIAKRFKCSLGNVSQVRRKLVDKWVSFVA